MKMKGILKRLATLTIMAALVLCLLPMVASAASYNGSVTFDNGIVFNVTASYKGDSRTPTIWDPTITRTGVGSFQITITDLYIATEGGSVNCDNPSTFTIQNLNCTEPFEWSNTYTRPSDNLTWTVTITREATEHSWQEATCTTPATCTTCGGTTGEVNPDAHSWGGWTYENGNHNGVCSYNDQHKKSGNCEPGEDGNCTVCHASLVASVHIPNKILYFTDADAALKYADDYYDDTVTILKDATVNRGTVAGNLVVNSGVTLTFSGLSGDTEAFARVEGNVSGGGTIGGRGVTLEVEGGCSGCTFNMPVWNYGTITGGIFNKVVENYGTITGGTFENGIKNYGTIKGGKVYVILWNAIWNGENSEVKTGTVYADDIKLGSNFNKYIADEGTTLHCKHTHATAATCMKAQTCPFGCTGLADIDPNAHSLTYSIATDSNNTITETCAHGCDHRATATLDISTDSVTYNGAAQTIATVTHSGTWLGERLTAQYENNTNVGTATVYIQAGEAKAVKTFAITKATPTLEHFDITLPQNAVYDGTEKAATVIVKDGITGMGGIGIKYFQNDVELNETPTNAGTYTVKFKTASGDNYNQSSVLDAGTFTIAKADTIVTAPMAAAERFVYNGNPQLLTTAGTANGGYRVLYWMKTEDPYSENVLTATDAGTYTVKWYAGSHSDTNYNRNQGEITVTIEPATITVTPTENQSITYGDTLPNLMFGATGEASGEQPSFPGALTIDSTKPGTYKIKKGTLALADDESTGFKASNYTLVVDETVDFVINKRELSLTVENQTITYGKSIDPAEYTVEGLADGDKATVKLTPSTENITKSGTITAEITIKNAAGEDVTGCYDISKNSGKLTIDPDLSAIENLTVDNVHHSNEEDIKAVQDMLDKAEADVKNDQNITEAQQKCATLLVRINESLDALRTDAIEDTLGTTASNVKLADKATINEAIGDIEEAKTDYAGNYNTADKAALNAQIANLEAALDAIEKAETVIDWMNGLPADVEPDDAKAIEAKAAYDELTSNEKNMVASATATKLAALSTYKIVKGDKATWEKGKTLTFTINGDCERFKRDGMVKVDGKVVDDKYYEAEEGSTIVTLKKSFFEQKSISSKATHEIIFMFGDGEVRGTFYIHKDAMTPATGDSSGIVLWTVILFASTAALAAVIVISRKRKNA